MRDKLTAALSAVLLSLTLSACGGGGGGGGVSAAQDAPPPEAEAETGKVIIGVTDAPGDFVSYEVDVRAIRLERASGATVETLPLTTRIDFAELTELTELLTVATVPAGVYTTATLTLDYTTAEVLVQAEDGSALPAAVFDENGAPAGVMDVRLSLSESDVLRIAPGVPAAFSLDFDLDASNDIDLTSEPVTVTASPFLLAMAELEADREHRLRGLFSEADVDAATVTVDLRPFRSRSGRFGELTFSVSEDAAYELDGESFMGVDGLTALSALPENAPLLAQGVIEDGGFLAQTVLAGSSVPWTAQDVVLGVVAAREGDLLTVRGAVVQYADGLTVRRDEVAVSVGADTTVTALGIDPATLDAGSISVGQRVTVFGELSDDLEVPALDATAGRVRMKISQLTGSVVQPAPLVVDLALLNGRRPAVYDFSGTGVEAALDADPESYEIATATLGLLNLDAGELVRVRGLVNGFGMAPNDFLARTVIDPDLGTRPASFAAVWSLEAASPVTSVASDRVALDLTEARALLKIRGVPLPLVNPLESLALVAPEADRGVYALRVRGQEIRLYRSFADFATALLEQLEEGRQLRRAAAHGGYNEVMDLTTRRASFDLFDPTAVE